LSRFRKSVKNKLHIYFYTYKLKNILGRIVKIVCQYLEKSVKNKLHISFCNCKIKNILGRIVKIVCQDLIIKC